MPGSMAAAVMDFSKDVFLGRVASYTGLPQGMGELL